MSQVEWVIPNASVSSSATINFLIMNDFGGQDAGSYRI
ncbi:conserved domain protein [Yersinia pestis KIM D27]|nr:conserved domain protein [Yersinia pestis KIM D27]